MRLAKDLQCLLGWLTARTGKGTYDEEKEHSGQWKAIGGSLGCSILW